MRKLKPLWTKEIINYNMGLPNPEIIDTVIIDNDEVNFYFKNCDQPMRWGPHRLLFALLELLEYKNVEAA